MSYSLFVHVFFIREIIQLVFSLDWEAIVKLSDGFNGADLRNVCTEAGMLICLYIALNKENNDEDRLLYSINFKLSYCYIMELCINL